MPLHRHCFISKPLLHTAIYVVYQCRNVLEKILTTSSFRSTFPVTTEVNNYNQTKSITVICCTVVREWPHSESFKFLWQFLLILQHLLMRYVWNHCDQAAVMVWIIPFCWDYQIDLSFGIREAAQISNSAKFERNGVKIKQYCFILTPFLSNFAEFEIDY